MTNKCVVVGCNTGHTKRKRKLEKEKEVAQTISSEKKSMFHFPKNNEVLNAKWIKFISRVDFKPSDSSVICSDHFEAKYLLYGDKRTHLNRELEPVPTIYPAGHVPTSSLLPSSSCSSRKLPTDRRKPDQFPDYHREYKICDFDALNEKLIPGFTFKKNDDHVIYFLVEFSSGMPQVTQSIIVDVNMHVKLFYKDSPIPLPEWFRQGQSNNCKLTDIGQLQNFPIYIVNRVSEMPREILQEMQKIQYIKAKGRPPYSSELIRFALMQRYTSRQSYNLLLNELPLPSFSLLQKLTQGGIDPIKSLQMLLRQEKVDSQCMLLIDEMYLQKSCQYHGGKFYGKDEDGDFYNGIVVFMVVGLRKSIPYVIKTLPETKISGEWLKPQILESLCSLHNAGFYVRAVITDNHSVNVAAFSLLKKQFSPNNSDEDMFIIHPSEITRKVYLFYDSVHLLKNIRNNLLNAKRFIFPPFLFQGFSEDINVNGGEISWHLLNCVYEMDNNLQANLRKAPKLNYETLHPGNKKQNVQLALNIFHETTTAAISSYFPDREDTVEFIRLINTWWNISNSKYKFDSHNRIKNGVVLGDKKTDFLRELADWFESWKNLQMPLSEKFTLTKQTCSALVTTLRATAALTDDLLGEGFEYVLLVRFQSDPIERRFSIYRQMSGGRFLVSLREVMNSEKIILLKSLLKENVDFEAEDINDVPIDNMEEITRNLKNMENEIQESALSQESEEVSVYITGYIIKKLLKRFGCNDCKYLLLSEENAIEDKYIKLLNRGGLLIPSSNVCLYSSKCFAILEVIFDVLLKYAPNDIRNCAAYFLDKYLPSIVICCSTHNTSSRKWLCRIVSNIYINNNQKISNSEIRKDDVKRFKARQTEKRKVS